ncbi:protein shisa-5-like [Ruditapes philippinarum]|uniref:protein shisa-5-like n=1 Tax=Ruditapes philippinarum TaxID=129788 RepID=UPI00295BD246|nr:protein shisa-5-like [Ruditapes philippinarum]
MPEVIRLFSLINNLLLSFLPVGASGDSCYNIYYSETYECTYGCCGSKYDYDYGCCTITGIVAGAVFGTIFIVAVIVVLVYICKKKKQRGSVINPSPQHATRVTVVQPPAYQPHPQGPPPSYPGPPPGGSSFQPGYPQPQTYPPPHTGPGYDPAYRPKY